MITKVGLDSRGQKRQGCMLERCRWIRQGAGVPQIMLVDVDDGGDGDYDECRMDSLKPASTSVMPVLAVGAAWYNERLLEKSVRWLGKNAW